MVLGENFIQATEHFGRSLPRLNVSRDLDLVAGQFPLERILKPRRIGKVRPVRPGKRGGSGAQHADVEPMLVFECGGDAAEIDFSFQKRRWHVARLGLWLRHGPPGRQTVDRNCYDKRDEKFHASPPARSASGGLIRPLGLRPSICLYHDIRLAVATMIKMPTRLINA